jgi:uncharacterized membrane protein HdeD (DUF308 family)
MAVEVKEREVLRRVEEEIAYPIRRFMYADGIALVVLGMLSILMPFIAGLVVNVLLGVVMIAAGFSWCAFGSQAPGGRSRLGSWVTGLLAILCGIYMLVRPVTALAALTLAAAAFLMAAGLMRIFMSIELRHYKGWGWGLFNGFVTVALGVLIAVHWPFSGYWAIGILLGVDMMMAGLGLAGLGRARGYEEAHKAA